MKKIKKILKRGIVLILCLACIVVNGPIFTNAEWSTYFDFDLKEMYLKKIDKEIYEAAKGQEKIPIVVWYADIDQTKVEEEVETVTGLTLESLSSIKSNFDSTLDNNIVVASDVATNADTTEILGDINRFLDESKLERQQEKEQTEKYIKERRAVSKGMYAEAASEIKEVMSVDDDAVIFTSKYVPMMVLQLSLSEIEQMARNESVLEINFYEELESVETADWMKSIRDTSGITKIREMTGLDGGGVKIGIVESCSMTIGGDVPASRCTNLTPVFLEDNSHVMNTVSILGSNNGVAPGSTIYSAACEGFIQESGNKMTAAVSYCLAIEKLIDSGAMIINSSFGFIVGDSSSYSDIDRWVDHVVSVHNVTFVQSAGNDAKNEGKTRILSPGLSDNVLTIGAYDNQNTENINDDKLFDYSSFNHVNGCYKPDVLAPANMGGGGTSSAAPYVSGVIAMMMQLRPSLAAYPQAVKAILMASCQYKALPAESGDVQELMTSGLTDRQGAGVIDPYLAICITGQGNYGVREMKEDESEQNIRIIQPSYAAKGINVSIAWLRENYVSEENQEDPLSSAVAAARRNLDLNLIHGGEVCAASALTNSSSEMTYYQKLNNLNTEYTIQIKNITKRGTIRYGYAWSIDKNRFQTSKQYEGIYFLKNADNGQYMGVSASTTGLLTDVYLFHPMKLWVIQKDRNETGYHIMNGGNSFGYLTKGDSVSATYISAKLAETEDGYLQLLPVDNGSIQIVKKINNKDQILGVYNNSLSGGRNILWSGSQEGTGQQWYLEKCAYFRGDIDMNGLITTDDANIILLYAVGGTTFTSAQKFLADVDGDGVISTDDANMVLKMAAGQI